MHATTPIIPLFVCEADIVRANAQRLLFITARRAVILDSESALCCFSTCQQMITAVKWVAHVYRNHRPLRAALAKNLAAQLLKRENAP